MGARTDVRFLLFPAVCEWFYHVLTVPHVLSGVVSPFINLNIFFRGRGCSVPGSLCYSISNNKSQQRRSVFLRDVKVSPFPQNVLSRKCDNDCEDRRTKKTPVSESVDTAASGSHVVPVFCASTLGRLPNHQPSCLTGEVIASGADENARPS